MGYLVEEFVVNWGQGTERLVEVGWLVRVLDSTGNIIFARKICFATYSLTTMKHQIIVWLKMK